MTSKHAETLSRIKETLQKCKTFFIAGHIKPDGDTVGSALALESMLKRMGKKAEIYSRETVPEYFNFLEGARKIKVTDKVKKEFDCAIILECVNTERMGDIISLDQAAFVINIDHHAHFNNFGHINFVEPAASSSAEQVFNIFRYLEMPLTQHEAEALYAGLVTDTGKFQQNNTTEAAFEMAAALVKAGVQPSRIYEKIYACKTLSSLRLLGYSLNTLKVTPSGLVAYMEIKQSMYRRAKSDITETEEIVNYAMMIPGVIVGMLIRETETPGLVKISFRSRNSFDVNKTAQHFGGGGHKNAAGCSIKGTLKQAEQSVLKHLSRNIKIR